MVISINDYKNTKNMNEFKSKYTNEIQSIMYIEILKNINCKKCKNYKKYNIFKKTEYCKIERKIWSACNIKENVKIKIDEINNNRKCSGFILKTEKMDGQISLI